jgi:rSAM/selenodomain-associated transferase 2
MYFKWAKKPYFVSMISVIIPAYHENENLKGLLPLLGSLESKLPVEIFVSWYAAKGEEPGYDAPERPLYLVKAPKQGRAVQMNHAAAKAKGDVLVFLHADVRPPKSFLTDIAKAIEKGFEAGFFSYRFDKKSRLLAINASFTTKKGLFTGGGDQCLFIKKNLFTEIGGFDENQVLMEDFEFFKRMKRKNVPYTIIKNDLIVSSRKYDHNSYLRINLTNLLLLLLFNLGYPPKKLKSLHDKLLNTPYQNPA